MTCRGETRVRGYFGYTVITRGKEALCGVYAHGYNIFRIAHTDGAVKKM